jgi:hypothetical protein
MKKGSILTCGSWKAARQLCNILAEEEGSTMDIVHCYDAINQFNAWYPKYQKRCLNRARQLPTVTALRLPYIEKAKEIFQDELKKMINKGLTKLETINNIFWHYYGMNSGPLRVMEIEELAQKFAEQLVSDSVERDGTDNSTGVKV